MSTSASSSSRKIAALFKEIRAACAAHANPQIVKKYSRYFVEGYDGYGVDFKSEDWKQLMEGWFEKHRPLGIAFFLALGDRLVQTGKYEEGSLAIIYVSRLKDQFNPEVFGHLATWFDGGFRNWAHTDVFCGEVMSHFLKAKIAGLDDLVAWRESPHRFQRRAVPVGLISLLKETSDYKPLLDLIRPMMHDGEKVVHQGLGWFLRETWKKQPKLVEAFLLEHKDTAPRLIFQYATEKMTAEQKKRFRRG